MPRSYSKQKKGGKGDHHRYSDYEHEITEAKLFFDMLMMALVTGRERCEKEWEKLFLEAGFSRYKITPMFGLRSLIEVYP